MHPVVAEPTTLAGDCFHPRARPSPHGFFGDVGVVGGRGRRPIAWPRLRSPARARQRPRGITAAGPARSGGSRPEIRHERDPIAERPTCAVDRPARRAKRDFGRAGCIAALGKRGASLREEENAMQETDHIHEDIHPKRPTRPTRARLFTIAAVASGVLVAGCGGSSPSATTGGAASSTASAVANAGAATTSASSSPGSSPSPAQPDQNLLNFARCMRANGVPNFPDPKPGGRFRFPRFPRRPPSRPRRRSVRSCCRTAGRRRRSTRRRWCSCARLRSACASTASLTSPTRPGSHDGTVRAPTRREPGSRLPRGPARVPGHARHKLARVRAGGDCVRRRRDPQGPLIKARNRPETIGSVPRRRALQVPSAKSTRDAQFARPIPRISWTVGTSRGARQRAQRRAQR